MLDKIEKITFGIRYRRSFKVNDISGDTTGFETESNQILLISASGAETLPHTTKLHSADLLLDRVRQLVGEKP